MRLGRGLDVIGRAAIGELAPAGIEHREGGGRIAVARLADRAEHGEPLPARQQRHGTPALGMSAVILPVADIE